MGGKPMNPATKALAGKSWTSARRRQLLQDAITHDGDALSHRHRFDLIMRHVEQGDAEPCVQLDQLRAHLEAELGIEIGKRLVHQEHLRPAHDRTSEGNPLALTAGKLRRLAIEQRVELKAVSDVCNEALAARLVHVARFQRELDVLPDCHVRVERIALEDHRDVALCRADVVNDVATYPDDRLRSDLRGLRPIAAPSTCRSPKAPRRTSSSPAET